MGADQPAVGEVVSAKKGRELTPSYLIIDSQSVKTNYEGEQRGFHGGKKIKGRSRQCLVDTQGNLWSVHVHAANQHDTVAGCQAFDRLMGQTKLPRLKAVCADQGYRKTFVKHLEDTWKLTVHISQKIADHFAIIPKRWVVERTFGWFNGQRRLSKDYEKTTSSSEAMIYLASISRILKSC